MIHSFAVSSALTAALVCFTATAQQQSAMKLHLPDASATTPLKLRAADTAQDATSPDEPGSGLGPGLSDFSGTIDGRLPVHFTIVVATDRTVTGTYFLTSDLEDHSFHGKMIDPQSFSARVAEASGPTAAPYLYLKVSQSHPAGDWLSGALYGDGGASQHSISLEMKSHAPDVFSEQNRYAIAGASDDRQVEHNAQAFWQAVLNNQPDKAAQFVAYPLAYTDNGRRTLLHTPQDFENRFSAIFTPQFVAELKQFTPKAMAADAQGIRLGNGDILFNAEGKAFALNNEQVRMFAAKHFMTNAGWHPKKASQ